MSEQPPQDPLRPAWPQPPGRGPRKRFPPSAVAIALVAAAIIALIVTLGATQHDSTGSTAAPAAAPPSSSALASAPSAAASPAPCTTHACVVEDAKGLVGDVAKDESVLTAMSCYESTVKNPDPGVYTVHCLATYSDGSQWDGIASVLISKGQLTWEPTELVSGG
jgi:hypothetical protein